MKLVPLLAIQRGLYNIPNLNSRFETYLDTMLDSNRQDIRLPLQNMNPMAKSHIPKLLDHFLEADAEQAAQQVMNNLLVKATFPSSGTGELVCYSELPDMHELSMGLVLADDALGGWTDRVDVEFKNVFQTEKLLKRGWVEALLWSSDLDDDGESNVDNHYRDKAKLAVELALHRVAYQRSRFGPTTARVGGIGTLGDMLAQESWVWNQHYKHNPNQYDDNLRNGTITTSKKKESAIQLLHQYEDATVDNDFPTIVAMYFGDEAAEARGYPVMGMSDTSGRAVSQHGFWDGKTYIYLLKKFQQRGLWH